MDLAHIIFSVAGAVIVALVATELWKTRNAVDPIDELYNLAIEVRKKRLKEELGKK
jgi:hypothetical protein